MHKQAKQTILWRVMTAGALLAASLVGVEAAHAQDGSRSERFFNRILRRPAKPTATSKSAVATQTPNRIQLVQNEVPPPPFQADERERTFEEPTAPAQQPAYKRADDKEKAPEEPADEPWVLTNLFTDQCGYNCLKECGFKVSGHSQWGYSSAPDGAFQGNGPFVNQQEWGQFNLNQQYLYIEKIADGKKGLDWGVRFDMMYGVDGNEGQSFGNVNPGHYDYLNGFDHGAYEWAFPQLYAEVACCDVSIKAGHFYTIVGYEVVPSTGQFFFSRQLTFWNSEPFTHTGALATWKATDKLTVIGGWVLGMDSGFYQYLDANAFLGGITYQIDDKTTFVYSMTGGDLGWRGDGAINSFILSRQWTKCFTTVHQFDVLGTNLLDANGNPASFANPASFTPRNSTGLINYAFYDMTDTVKAGVRFEWFKADGTSYYTLTGGVNYKPCPWLLIRPEVRGMWSPGNHDTYTGVHGYSSQLFNQCLFGIDAIVIF